METDNYNYQLPLLKSNQQKTMRHAGDLFLHEVLKVGKECNKREALMKINRGQHYLS